MTSTCNPSERRHLRVETITSDGITWVILRGESDIAVVEDLATALAHIELDGSKFVHLHLHDLAFADSATLRELFLFARQVKRAGRDVQTCGASPTLHQVARVLGVHDELGMS